MIDDEKQVDSYFPRKTKSVIRFCVVRFTTSKEVIRTLSNFLKIM